MRRAAAVAVLAALGCAASLQAQVKPEPESPQSLASRWLTRLALADLRIVGAPKPTDYRITAELLEIAKKLTPDDEPLTRLLLEAQDNAGNQVRVDELTKEIIRFDPLDTVAQLRLVTSRIRQLQRVDDRLAAYDRLIGKEGDKLDAAVRSRLALDASLLAREAGDAEGFARRLTRAVELDATNKDAATLALTFFSQRVNDPIGRFELMLGVLNADPIDPDTHMAISRDLAASGAVKGANRFRKTANVIRRNLGIENSADEEVELSILSWHAEGPRALVQRFNTLIADARTNALRRREAAKKDNEPLDKLPEPNQLRLNMSNEWMRLLASQALGDEDLLRPALEEFVESTHQEIEHLSKSEVRGPEVSEEEAVNRTRGLREETIAARLWSGKELDKAAQELDVLRADSAADPVKLRRLDALSKLRAGQIDTAAAQLLELGPDDDVAQLWLCLVEEARGDKAASVARYVAFAHKHYGTLFGAYATTRAERLSGKPVPPEPTTAKLEQLAAAVPGWVESIIESPRRFQTMSVRVEPLEARMLDDVRMSITVRNVAPIAMGVGPDRPINTRLLIAPNVQVATDQVITSSMLQVGSLERRLRLLPREEFQVTLEPDAGSMGMLLDEVYSKPVRVRYRVLQGFEMLDGGAYDAGPYCLNADGGPVVRPVSNKANADVATLTRWVQSGTPRELVEALLLMRGRDSGLSNAEPLKPDEQKSIFTELATRFPKLEPAWQVAVLGIAPTGVQSAKILPTEERSVQALDDVARASTDPMIRTIMLTLRIDKSDDPLLDPAAYASDARLASLAGVVGERLKQQIPCYATYAPAPPPSSQAEKPKGGAGGLAQPTDK